MKWKIVTDSGSTVQREMIETEQIAYELAPLTINIGNQVFTDDVNLELKTFIQAMKDNKEAATSACPSPNAFASAFQGADVVLCFTLSSGLSGSYNSAVVGKDLALEANPNIKIHIFDTLSAGTEMDLLVLKAKALIEQGEDFESVIQQINAYHEHTQVAFMLESVDNLVKNGRLNKLVGSMIGLLGIRLIGVRTAQGKIDIAAKAKGAKRALKAVIEQMQARGYAGGNVVISHSDNAEGVEALTALLQQQYPEAVVTSTLMNGLCCFYAQDHGMIIGYETK